ncbi:MAG: hypothetical protein KDE04_13725 [Anaerolineales bacterium]|nr:hypothetical protein [Anaerolineales bacterium]
MKHEKIIQEYKVIETEDGYRIEIKGDKEALRRLGLPDRLPFAGDGMRFRHWGKRRWRQGPHGRGHEHRGHEGAGRHDHERHGRGRQAGPGRPTAPHFWKRGRRWGWEEEADPAEGPKFV